MKTLFLMTTALTLAAGLALAQPEAPGAEFITQWDMNNDAIVTLDEAVEKRAEIFWMFDAEGDGILDAADWVNVKTHLAFEEETKGGAHSMGRGPGQFIHDAMELSYNDADGDGRVTPEEFSAATKTLFPQIDRNGDGVMTLADFGRM
jgi:Ca2+-binding EF-hand superfamily protein